MADTIVTFLQGWGLLISIIVGSTVAITVLNKGVSWLKKDVTTELNNAVGNLCTKIDNHQSLVSNHLNNQDKQIEQINSNTKVITSDIKSITSDISEHLAWSQKQIGDTNVKFENHEGRITRLETDFTKKFNNQLKDTGVK